MITQVSKLCSEGDIKITWDDTDEASKADARREIAEMKKLGYSFFLVTGELADEVTAGGGALNVRRIPAEELLEEPGDVPEIRSELPAIGPDVPETQTEAQAPIKRGGRGRPAKQVPDRKVIAVPRQRGG